MKTLKALTLVSFSVFLLAVSWVLVTGQLGQVPLAHAQLGGAFVALTNTTSPDTGVNAMFGLTEAGDLYRLNISNSGSAEGSAVFVGNLGSEPPISSSDESVGRLKSNY